MRLKFDFQQRLSRRVWFWIALVAVTLFPWGVRQATRPAPVHELWVPPDRLDFGSASPQEEFRWTFPVINRSCRDIEIVGFRPSCQCTAVEPKTLRIPPGESRSLRLALNLMPASEADLESPIRPFAVTVQPIFKGGWPRQDGWQVTGVVRNPYVVSPPFVNFGDSLVEGHDFGSRTVEVRCEEPIIELAAKSQAVSVTTAVNRDAVDNQLFRVIVTPRGDLPLGTHEFRILLQGTTPQGGRLLSVPLKGLARVVPDAEIAPPMLAFGMVDLGETVQRDLLIASRSGRPIEISGVDGTVRAIELVGEPPAGSATSHNLQFSLRADRAGFQTGEVAVHVQTSGQADERELAVRYCYSGVDPGQSHRLAVR